jgi:hypothetical protein
MFYAIAQLCKFHPMLAGALAMALANAAITAMPSPRPDGNEFYAWAFNFLHSAVGAVSRIVAQYKNGTSSAPKSPETP